MILRIISIIIPFIMLFIGFEIASLGEGNVFFGVKLPEVNEINNIVTKYKRLFRIFWIISWGIVNIFIIYIDISAGEYYIVLMMMLTIIIDGVIMIVIYSIINRKLKIVKNNNGWKNIVYSDRTFTDKKTGEKVIVDDNDYLLGVFYYKSKDPSLLVARKNGKGITLNFANKIGRLIGIGIIIAMVVIVGFTTYNSVSLANATTLNLVLENENVVVNGKFGDLLPYKEMTSVEYLDETPKVEVKLDGVQIGNKYFGIYNIEGVGKAKLYIENINEPVVKIVANGYLPVYVNYNRLSSTQWLYNSVVARRNSALWG